MNPDFMASAARANAGQAGCVDGALATDSIPSDRLGSGATSNGQSASVQRVLQVVAAFALVLATFAALNASAASAAEGEVPPYVKSFGPDGTEGTDFSWAGPVAVDQVSHAVYVLDQGDGSLYKFDIHGQPVDWGGNAAYIEGNRITGLTGLVPQNGSAQIAVNPISQIIYVTSANALRAFAPNGEPAEFTSGPGAGSSEIGGFGELRGVAVDAEGAIYASDLEADAVTIFAPSGEQITQFAAENPRNLAVDSHGAVYVVRVDVEGGAVVKYVPSSSLPVMASTIYSANPDPFDPVESYTVATDPATDDVYVVHSFVPIWIDKEPGVTRYASDGSQISAFAGSDEEGAVSRGLGIAIDDKSGLLFVGDVNDPRNQVHVFGEEIIEGPPRFRFTAVSEVSSNFASLHAEINPNTAATTYRFEYGLQDCAVSACAGVPLDGVDIAAGHTFVSVTQDVEGLLPGSTYYYRVVAENSFGAAAGPSKTFRTDISSFEFQLPDDRAWEMVSPPDKHGGSLAGKGQDAKQAAADGTGLVYPSSLPVVSDPEGNRVAELSTNLARRSEDGSWNTTDLITSNDRTAPGVVGGLTEYKLFDSDLSRALLEPRSGTPLSPEASERTPYLRDGDPPVYTPLVTGKEGFANVPPGTEFGGQGGVSAVEVVAASPDLSHVGLRSGVPLVSGAPDPGLTIYEWTGREIKPVGVLPAAEGGAMVAGAKIGSEKGSVRGAISEDGTRVFWSTSNALYVRDTQAEATARLDVPRPGASEAGPSRPRFQGASVDGSVVYFTDPQQLTPDASPEGSDLYRCTLPLGGVPSGCVTLTDLSVPTTAGESAFVQGLAPDFADDGGTIYFVATGVLEEAPNQFGDGALSGSPNLYVWREGEGVRFIATLTETDNLSASRGDSLDWGGVEVRAGALSATASPSGRFLVFMSENSLTGYATRRSGTEEGVEEAFRYDSTVDRLDCISCNPSGQLPLAPRSPGGESLVDPAGEWIGRRIAATLPAPTTIREGGISIYRPRTVFDSGRVFFNAIDSLVPADSNGEWDVYQYEPAGVGDCSSSSTGASVSETAGGCVALISSGTAEEEAGFIDASKSGDDAFFFTTARLNETDRDYELDVYDARVNGRPGTLPSRAECLGEACQPTVQPPSDPTPASASFRGSGNHRQVAGRRCPKGKRKVRRHGKVRCLPNKHHKHSHRRKAHR